MATVKAKDLRTKSDKELSDRALELRKEQFNLRFQRATGQLANPARFTAVRKEIAKIETLMSERRCGEKPKAKKTKKAA